MSLKHHYLVWRLNFNGFERITLHLLHFIITFNWRHLKLNCVLQLPIFLFKECNKYFLIVVKLISCHYFMIPAPRGLLETLHKNIKPKFAEV